MAVTSVNRSRRNERDEDDNINDVNFGDDGHGQEQEMTRTNLAKGVRKRIFDDRSNKYNEDDEDNEESE